MNQVTIKIEGMHCDGCCKRVEKALNHLGIVEDVKVDLSKKEAVVSSYDKLDNDLLKETIENLGFDVVDIH